MTLAKYIVLNVILIGLELMTCVTCANISTSYDSANKLFADVVEANNPSLRPILDQSRAIEVSVEFHLMTFLDVDEVNEMVEFHGWFNVSWHDEIRKWDPANYSDIHSIYPDATRMWLPKMFAMTFVDDKDPFIHGSNIMKIYSDGRTRWYPVGKFKVLCPLDLTAFPKDKQSCDMMIVSSYLAEAIYLKPSTNEKKDFKDDSEEWDITTIWMYPHLDSIGDEAHNDLYIRISLSRYPFYFQYTVLAPVMVTSLLSLVSFFIPEDSGERLGFATTILLAMVVFLQLISETLPNASRSFPVVCEYLLLQCALAAMVIIVLIMHMRFTRWIKVIKLGQLPIDVRRRLTQTVNNAQTVNMNMNRNQNMNTTMNANANKTAQETDGITDNETDNDNVTDDDNENTTERVAEKITENETENTNGNMTPYWTNQDFNESKSGHKSKSGHRKVEISSSLENREGRADLIEVRSESFSPNGQPSPGTSAMQSAVNSRIHREQSDEIQLDFSPGDAQKRIEIKPNKTKKNTRQKHKTDDLSSGVTVFIVFIDHFFDWLMFCMFFTLWLIITLYYLLVKLEPKDDGDKFLPTPFNAR